MVAKKFQIYCVKITGKHICESVHFCSCPQQNAPPGSYHNTPGRRKLPISSEQRFLKIVLSPAERGEDYGAEKMTKIKLARAFVTSFDKFYHLCMQPLHFSFLFCCTIIKIRECWRFFNLTNKIFTKKFSVQEYLHERYNLTLPCFLTISPTTICQKKNLYP